MDPNLSIKFSLVGREFDLILQSSIFSLSYAFSLHIFCEGTLSGIEVGFSSWSTLYANLRRRVEKFGMEESSIKSCRGEKLREKLVKLLLGILEKATIAHTRIQKESKFASLKG